MVSRILYHSLTLSLCNCFIKISSKIAYLSSVALEILPTSWEILNLFENILWTINIFFFFWGGGKAGEKGELGDFLLFYSKVYFNHLTTLDLSRFRFLIWEAKIKNRNRRFDPLFSLFCSWHKSYLWSFAHDLQHDSLHVPHLSSTIHIWISTL